MKRKLFFLGCSLFIGACIAVAVKAAQGPDDYQCCLLVPSFCKYVPDGGGIYEWGPQQRICPVN